MNSALRLCVDTPPQGKRKKDFELNRPSCCLYTQAVPNNSNALKNPKRIGGSCPPLVCTQVDDSRFLEQKVHVGSHCLAHQGFHADFQSGGTHNMTSLYHVVRLLCKQNAAAQVCGHACRAAAPACCDIGAVHGLFVLFWCLYVLP